MNSLSVKTRKRAIRFLSDRFFVLSSAIHQHLRTCASEAYLRIFACRPSFRAIRGGQRHPLDNMLLSRHFTSATLLKESLRRSLFERVPLCPWQSSQTIRRTVLRHCYLSSPLVNKKSCRVESAMFYSELLLDRASHLRYSDRRDEGHLGWAVCSGNNRRPWRNLPLHRMQNSSRGGMPNASLSRTLNSIHQCFSLLSHSM